MPISPFPVTPAAPPAVAPFNAAGTGALGLPTMQASFTPAFVELTGAGPTLQSLTASAADAAAGRVVIGTVAGVITHYQVRAGTDADAAPGIIRPANFDQDTNPVVFVQC